MPSRCSAHLMNSFESFQPISWKPCPASNAVPQPHISAESYWPGDANGPPCPPSVYLSFYWAYLYHSMVLDKPIKKKVSLLYEYFTNEQKDRNH